jgi:NAD+ kinase
MKSKFRQIALIGKYAKEVKDHKAVKALENANSPKLAPAVSTSQILQSLTHFLHLQGADVVIEQETAASCDLTNPQIQNINQIGKSCDLAIVVGGDGTMLGFGRQLAPYGVPLIGINQGRLGFITDIALDQIETTLAPMLQGNYTEDFRSLFLGKVIRDDACVFSTLAMNDVVVNRGATAGMVELRVEVNGHFLSNQRADGLIIATPTGSTAYALSSGGPIIHPSLAGWVLVPIAPHTLSNRPIVLGDDAQIAIELVSGKDASANFDMQSLASLIKGDRISVSKSEHRARFLHPVGWSYFDTLRKKLHWNEGVA